MKRQRSIPPVFVLVIILASFTVAIQPIKANSGTLIVTSGKELVNALYRVQNGDTIFAKKGIYEMPADYTLVISRSISLIGEDPNSTILNLHPAWTQHGWNYMNPAYDWNFPLEIKASNVTISGFTITSDGGFISVSGYGVQIAGNKIATPLGIGGYYQNVSQNNLTSDISFSGSFSTIAGNHVVGGGIGLMGDASSLNMIYDNIVSDGKGISLTDFGVQYAKIGNNGNMVFNNTVKNCSTGLNVQLTYYSSNNTVYHNNFIENNKSVQFNTNSSVFLDNGKEGNYWSDYTGADANEDGIGDVPYWIDSEHLDLYPLIYPWISPSITVFEPTNSTYLDASVNLNFSATKPTSWIGYCFDNQANVTILGNSTLTSLPEGSHTIIVYANDTVGNMGKSETVVFTVIIQPSPTPNLTPTISPSPTQQPTPESTQSATQTAPQHSQPFLPFLTIIVAAVVAAVISTGVGLAIYFKQKQKKEVTS